MFFVKVTQIYSNREVYLRSAILVIEIFCYRYSTVNNYAQKQYFKMKSSDRFSNSLRIECTILYSHSFGFDIFIVRCLGGYLFSDTVYLIFCIYFGYHRIPHQLHTALHNVNNQHSHFDNYFIPSYDWMATAHMDRPECRSREKRSKAAMLLTSSR